ncbi:MAG: hypothetical protein R3C56_04470 [Pirellulaceae bacterium]
MRRRSFRSKRVSLLGAFLIEAGTMLAFIALAQPTWTRNFIEQVTVSPAATSVSTSGTDAFNAVSNIPQSAALQPTLAYQTLRPTPPQQVALPQVSAPALLNVPAPLESNTAWNDDPTSHRYVVNNTAVNNNSSPQAGAFGNIFTFTAVARCDPGDGSSQLVNVESSAAEYRYAPQSHVYPPSNWSNSY